MRPSSLRLAIRPIPLSSVAPNLVRLPPKASPKPSKLNASAASPTIDRLLANVAKRSAAQGAIEGGEANSTTAAGLPPNLRIEEFVPRRKEYAGVSKLHRTVLQKLRREN